MNKYTMIYRVDYFGFVYEWYDRNTSMKYLGSHHGAVSDPYKGSNVRFQRAIRKRPVDFTRKILEYSLVDDKNHTLFLEQKWLDSVDNIKDDPGYYNQKNEACGGWSFITEDHIKRRSESLKEKHSKQGLSEREISSYKKKIAKRLSRISNTGFTKKEQEQHNKFSTKVEVIFPDNTTRTFQSITKCSRELGIDARYGTVATIKSGSYKGYKIFRIASPEVPCYRNKNEFI
jgi:hypothetical protein